MNAGEINTKSEMMNFTMNNEPIMGDIDRLIFNPIDFHHSFDRFHYNSYHFFEDRDESKTKLIGSYD